MLFILEVISNQRLLYEHRIVQYLQNSKYYDVYQDHFRKPLQSYQKTIKRNCPKSVRLISRVVQFVTIFDV